MAGLEQPSAPAKPVPILTDDEVTRLLKAAGGTSFEDRRDHAILRVLLDQPSFLGWSIPSRLLP